MSTTKTLQNLKSRAFALLSRFDADALSACIPVAGVLAAHGQPQALGLIPDRALHVGLDPTILFTDRVGECLDDMNLSSGEDLGYAVCDTQAVLFALRNCGLDAPEIGYAVTDLEWFLAHVPLDVAAAVTVERWVDRHGFEGRDDLLEPTVSVALPTAIVVAGFLGGA